MGKNGDALRAAKRQRVTYTFTREQLSEHDRQVRAEYKKLWTDEMHKRIAEENARLEAKAEEQLEELNRAIHDEWNARAESFMSEDATSNFYAYVACFMAIAVRVLIEQFGWKPLTGRGWKNTKLVRFSNAVKAEIEKISADETQDIRRYAKETTDLYGVGFAVSIEEDMGC